MAMPRAFPKTLIRPAICAAVLALWGVTAQTQEVTLSAPGASDDLLDDLRGSALLLRPAAEGETQSAQDLVAAARADYGRLVGALYENGYFAPVVSIRIDGREASQISPFARVTNVDRVEITVTPGPEFAFGTARIGPLARDTDLPPEFAPGQTATTPVLRDTTRAAIDGWRDEGRATADVGAQQITANNRTGVLDAEIEIAPGPVITFGNLLPEGQERMRMRRILEIAGLPTGEIFSPETLDRATERLRNTGVFSAVSLRETEPGSGNVMDIVAVLDEAPLRRLGFGIELSSDEGGGVSAFWLHRNLFGGAERLRFDAAVTGIGLDGDGIDVELKARIERPATFTADTDLAFEIDATYLDEPLFTSYNVETRLRLDHYISPELSVSGGVGLRYSQIDDALGSRNTTLVFLPLGAIYDTRDDPLDARSGFYVAATATPLLPLGGETGVRGTLDGRAYFGFGEEERLRLAGRVQVGSLAGASLADIPPDLLFFSGGAGTVRGQEYRSLGANRGGVTTGGRGFLAASGEVRYDIGNTNFGVVGFADWGYVSADALGQDGGNWHAGAGLGLRYQTPFGPIRVDLATPVGNGRTADAIFLYIGIGQTF